MTNMSDKPEEQSSPVTADVVEAVITDLCVDAPSSDIKDCLKAYEYGKGLKQLTAVFNQFSQECLVKTLCYLNVANRKNYLKTANVESVICRIQNLLPDVCNICNNVYCVKNSDPSFLCCAVCGQEMHYECLLNALSIEGDSDVKSLTKADVLSKLNPLNIPGWYYVCNPCSKAHIPNDKIGMKKKKKSDSSKVPAVETVFENAESTINNPENMKQNGDGNKDGYVKEGPEKPVCKFYRNKKCNHGMNGVGCKFSHPPICKKLLKYGHSNKGCKGENCDEFHPKMCYHSLKNKECHYEKCRFYHVSGTRFIEDNGAVGRNLAANGSGDGENYFLSHPQPSLQSLKTDILKTMDMRFAALMSCLQRQAFQMPTQSQPTLIDPYVGNYPAQTMSPPQMQEMQQSVPALNVPMYLSQNVPPSSKVHQTTLRDQPYTQG